MSSTSKPDGIVLTLTNMVLWQCTGRTGKHMPATGRPQHGHTRHEAQLRLPQTPSRRIKQTSHQLFAAIYRSTITRLLSRSLATTSDESVHTV